MAGHSKFKNIMHRKGAQDKKRSNMFSKLSREITVAAKMGLPDPDMNPRLRAAVNAAKAQSMPKDNIQRAIDKASGGDGENYEEIRYEGYGAGGVAVIVDCLTDNRVRTVADVRHAFGKFGGNMGNEGSVAFMFKKLGVLSYDAGANEDAITEAAIEAGADDIVVYPEDGAIDVLTSPDAFASVKAAMEAAGLAPGYAEITMRADNDSPVEGEVAEQVQKLLRWLEDMDDVQNVYANADFGGAA